MAIPDTKAEMPSQFEYDHLLHPTTLDGVFQTFFTGISGSQQAMLPTSIGSIVLSADLPKGAGAEFCGFTKVSRKGFRNYSGTITMGDLTWNDPKIIIKDIGCTELGLLTEELGSDKQLNAIRKLCSQLIWKEDIDHVRQIEGEQLFKPTKQVDSEYTAACERAAGIYMKRTVAGLTPEMEASMAPHSAQYVQWMRQRIGDCAKESSDSGAQDDEAFLADIKKAHIDGRLICAIGENLPGILDGSIPPLPIMMEDNMLFDYYASDSSNSMVTKFLELQGHKRPDYKILEIGAGQGSLTLPALETLGGRYGATGCFKEYVFTDSNPSNFENAQKLLKDWQAHLQYKKLDIESDPIEQGFEAESFELIIAGNVLHGTKNVAESLKHCHKLLKPGGKLVLTEFTNPLDRISFVLGALPSWWSAEDGRTGGPLLDEAEWKRHLLASGFSGVDIVIKDTNDAHTHCSSMMVATKARSMTFSFKKVVVIDAENPSEAAHTLSSKISKAISDLGLPVEHTTLAGAAAVDASGKAFVAGKGIICLAEAERPFVFDPSEAEFNAFKEIIVQSLGGLWVSRGGQMMDPSGDPSFCATTGLLRVCRCEMPDIRIHELNFSSKMDLASESAADLIARFFPSMYDDDLPNLETEASELNGRLYIPRLYDEKHKNHSLQTLDVQPQPEMQPFFQPGRPLRLDIGVPGMLDTLQFVDDPRPLEPMGEKEVEVEVLASAMNFV